MPNLKKTISKLNEKLENMTYKEAEEHIEKVLISYDFQLDKFDKITAFHQSVLNPSFKPIVDKKESYDDKFIKKKKKSKAFSVVSNNIDLIKSLLLQNYSYNDLAIYFNKYKVNRLKEITYTKQTIYLYIKELKKLKKWN
ncbi:MAG: hypothetical protein U9Q30_09280 [Campylobacterota bacterium]|nr:hypothetical protein [Campylobacterota bacterium]